MSTTTQPAATGPSASAQAEVQAQARFWNRMARRYAAARIADPAGYDTTLQRVAALLTPDQSVLEIGCGTGTTALRLAGGTRRMLATDVSPAMVAIARDRLAAQPVPQLRFALAAAGAAGDAEVHDVVLAFNVLHLLPDLDATLAASLATLKPGGRFISKTPCLREMHPAVPRLLLPLLRLVGLAPPLQVFDAAQLQAALVRQGLVIEAVERHGSKGRGKDWRVFIVARKPL